MGDLFNLNRALKIGLGRVIKINILNDKLKI